ncbi:MAG: hypothetical protein M3R65_04210 [Gemmatimonadota bacterium]|nr:hypothetical protein [Gemmatimonadota bacterium]
MNHATHMVAPRESVFSLLASLARSRSYGELSGVAAASGLVALGASVIGRPGWMVLSLCYLGWCFASWGLLFHASGSPSPLRRLLGIILVSSGAAVSTILITGVFFWALGPRWVL